ncbi:MAG: DoxX family protein [Phycisphaeraceae bacterium]|nr:DoxX family protein [Phycisphaeraceae bacterium]
MSKSLSILCWVMQIAAAGILLQTLFFKFSGAEESRYIFSTLGVEPWGRFAAGTAELVAVVLLLVPQTAAIGAALAAVLMGGAVMSHLTRLGVEVRGDGGLLFALAVVVLAASVGVVVIRRSQLPVIGPQLRSVAGTETV